GVLHREVCDGQVLEYYYNCIPRECYTEKCVMNNYFGIGLDAKISLDFNNKRDEHPKKCRSRTKNMMWYGVLGTKELLQRTYKNLEQRVLLEVCKHMNNAAKWRPCRVLFSPL
ncbi:hypothetical protein FKM82_028615, partial [Ascaphus truei]